MLKDREIQASPDLKRQIHSRIISESEKRIFVARLIQMGYASTKYSIHLKQPTPGQVSRSLFTTELLTSETEDPAPQSFFVLNAGIGYSICSKKKQLLKNTMPSIRKNL